MKKSHVSDLPSGAMNVLRRRVTALDAAQLVSYASTIPRPRLRMLPETILCELAGAQFGSGTSARGSALRRLVGELEKDTFNKVDETTLANVVVHDLATQIKQVVAAAR